MAPVWLTTLNSGSKVYPLCLIAPILYRFLSTIIFGFTYRMLEITKCMHRNHMG
ncbi:hypothetical protein B4096_3730 [Heyndrickxia coagulans]|nr:hypothetical protein B4096_3730 [Heyndrickxia coagulans]